MAAKTIHTVPLAQETRAALPTPEAAFHLNRAQQTLRLWAMRDGPIRPLRINLFPAVGLHKTAVKLDWKPVSADLECSSNG